MTEQSRSGLRELQRLDDAITAVARSMEELDESLEAVERPAQDLQSEVGTTRSRLQEMRVEERRVELSGQEKDTRLKKLEDRLGIVRNVREESAVTAEMDMVRRARESDEQEALHLLDQIRRLEDRLGEQSDALESAQAEVEPRRKELMEKRAAAEAELERLKKEREAFKASLDRRELGIYESIRKGGRRALASLTRDGACGNCFSMVPLQVQSEIRHGTSLLRCEACGVILAAPLEEEETAEGAGGAETSSDEASPEGAPAADASGDGGDAGSEVEAAAEDEEPATA
jgi:predicted  nucleic acid-binding Zn-ribbon protein